MGLRSSSVLCLALLLAFSSAINGLDITKLLSQYPEFESFNKYLTETKLAEEINGLKDVTVLAIDNTAVSSLSSKSTDAIKAIIGNHVLVGYYDEKKLVEAQGSHSQLVTLSPVSGPAKNILVSLINEGEVAFSSAVKGSPFDTKLVSTVTTEPDTVSILQVTQPIVAPGIDSSTSSKPSIAESPNAPAPGPASSSSRIHVSFFLGAIMALASLFVSL